MSEWIRCTDKDPKPNETVLIYNGSDIKIAIFCGSCRIFECADQDYDIEYATHWQSLPNPPEELK